MKLFFSFILLTFTKFLFSQNFTYTGYILNCDGSGVSGIQVGFQKQSNPNFNSQLSAPQYFNGHTYYESLVQLDWKSAKHWCDSLGGHLLVISDASENTFINTYFLSTNYWIGITDTLVEGTWETVTGESFSYSNFQGNNNNTTKNFSYIAQNGNWQFDNGTGLKNFVIEIETAIYYMPFMQMEPAITDSTGRFQYSTYINFGDEIQLVLNSPIVANSYVDSDAIVMNSRVLSGNLNSLDYYRFDVNLDGGVTITDVYYLYMKILGVFTDFPSGTIQTRIFTQSEWDVITNSQNDLRSSYVGIGPIYSPILMNGGSSNFYVVTTGFGTPKNLFFWTPQ